MESILKPLLHAVKLRHTYYGGLLRTLRSVARSPGDDPLRLATVLQKTLSSPLLDVQARDLLSEATTEAKKHSDRFALQTQSRVQEVCTRNSWALAGEWPTVFVERAVELRYHPRRRRLAVSGRLLPDLAAPALESALRESVQSLFPRGFSLEGFRDRLLEAHAQIAATETSVVTVLSLYRLLVVSAQAERFWKNATSSYFNQFTIEQFRAQLTRLLDTPSMFPHQGRRLRLYPPLNPDEGLYLFLPAESRFAFVGRLALEPLPGSTHER